MRKRENWLKTDSDKKKRREYWGYEFEQKEIVEFYREKGKIQKNQDIFDKNKMDE